MSACDQNRYRIVELSELATSDGLEHALRAAGAPPVRPTGRRKRWSELRGFDRASFDYEAYLKALTA